MPQLSSMNWFYLTFNVFIFFLFCLVSFSFVYLFYSDYSNSYLKVFYISYFLFN